MKRVYLDANILIAAFETSGALADHAWLVLNALESGRIVCVTSELTLAELLPRPMREGSRRLVDDYVAFLQDGPGLIVPAIARAILLDTAELRRHRPALKLADAIHIATAQAFGCEFFLSGDLRLNLPPGLNQLRLAPRVLDDLVG